MSRTDTRTDGQTDGRTDNVKTVYPTTNRVCGEYNYTVIYLAVGLLYKINFRREGVGGVGLIIFVTQYYPSKTRVFPVKPAGLGNTHKIRVFANLARFIGYTCH